jgi:signal peptidase
MIKKLWSALSTLLVILVVILAILLVGIRLIGLRPYVVLSGSMEPTYHVGSLIYVKEVDYKQLKVGDPITYMLNENTVVTHRIIQVIADESDPDTLRYFTQGDANAVADGTSVHYKNIIGKPVFSVPYLGYVSHFIQHPPGTYIAIAAGAALILLVFLPDVFPSEKDEEPAKGERGKSRKA